jgi:hypothetical protein
MTHKFRVWDSSTKKMILAEEEECTDRRVLMRYSNLEDHNNVNVVAGDIRVLNGKLYKVVDDGWRFRFERNLVEFHENEDIIVDEDTAYESTLVGDVFNNQHLLLNYQNNERKSN